MECCAACFGDSFLGRQIESLSKHLGDCSYCHSGNMPVISPIDLRDHFELLLGIYCEDASGKSLVDWFKSDWNLFVALDDAHCRTLLTEILDDGEIVRKLYRPVHADDSSSIDRWKRFRQELKHENRFFPRNIPDLERLGRLLEEHLHLDPEAIPFPLYRARVLDGGIPHPPGEMGKPPVSSSTNGRANPAGIPYLYLASNVDTAIAEIRPYTGESVCVAEFRLTSEPKIADLCNPRKTISPFSLSDEQSIGYLRNEIGFLCELGEELMRPVVPKAAHLEYLPSQYLCEFIKHRGFEGVMYRSSIGEGVNLALFDGASAVTESVTTYNITQVRVSRVQAELTDTQAT